MFFLSRFHLHFNVVCLHCGTSLEDVSAVNINCVGGESGFVLCMFILMFKLDQINKVVCEVALSLELVW